MKHKITCLGHCCDLHEADLDDEIKKAKEDIKSDIYLVIEEFGDIGYATIVGIIDKVVKERLTK